MELPQQRPFGTEGRKATHDFLSLYSHSSVQQDPRPPNSQGGYLKTHDFLQPLERVGKAVTKEETNVEISTVEKPPPPAPPPPPSVEHILPGGIGTYSISHISYFNQRVAKPEGAIFAVAQPSSSDKNDENSNCSSYTGSGFTLWEESALKKGKTGKENLGEKSNVAREAAAKVSHWTTTLERPLQSSSNNHRNSFNSRSSSQPPGQKSQSFMEMIKSAKGSAQDDEFDDEEEFVIKKESTSPIRKPELTVRIDGKSNTDQKANTPRSKHSATEQRRRSKINDRFQTLRELIPHGDQKRDKASFLLEVIEYIQFLQEKVHKYEGSYQGWNHEPEKLMAWRNNKRSVESYGDQAQVIGTGTGPPSLFAAKLDENNINIPPSVPGTAQNPVEPDMNSAIPFKAIDQHAGIASKPLPFAMSLQPNFFNPGRTGGGAAQLAPRLSSDAENSTVQGQPQSSQSRLCTTGEAFASNKLKEQELAVEGGTISISSVYSQGLLNTLTQALHNSGVDLSQASVSVQIELGKRGNGRSNAPTSIIKDSELTSTNQGTVRSRVSNCEESDQALKKLKTSNS
ncbi:hypothetical protein Tsubulata_048765 [Turnera subulata]|uniref:BHLH domain-containing protein n=1 Tax=Turnera subulata TaxID=218843 RepID=A0A9Q0F0A3_9ROSI|nr:hypothetical protein Tsubulata_048765 [Turnera subulata]